MNESVNCLIIGYGSIGARHADILKDMGHNVHAVTKKNKRLSMFSYQHSLRSETRCCEDSRYGIMKQRPLLLFFAFPKEAKFIDIGTPSSYKEAETFFMKIDGFFVTEKTRSNNR